MHLHVLFNANYNHTTAKDFIRQAYGITSAYTLDQWVIWILEIHHVWTWSHDVMELSNNSSNWIAVHESFWHRAGVFKGSNSHNMADCAPRGAKTSSSVPVRPEAASSPSSPTSMPIHGVQEVRDYPVRLRNAVSKYAAADQSRIWKALHTIDAHARARAAAKPSPAPPPLIAAQQPETAEPVYICAAVEGDYWV